DVPVPMHRAAHRKTRRQIPWPHVCSVLPRRTTGQPSPPWSMPCLPLPPTSITNLCAVFTFDRRDNARDHFIHVTVRQSAGLVLQNQAHSQTLEAGFDPFADIAIEQHHFTQQLTAGPMKGGRKGRPADR